MPVESADMTPIATQAADFLYWAFILVFLVNLTQRRHQEKAQKKRLATLYLGIAGFALFIIAQSIESFGGKDWMLIPGALAVFAVVYVTRDHSWPFIFRCPKTGRRLTTTEILYDDNPCEEKAVDSSTDEPPATDQEPD